MRTYASLPPPRIRILGTPLPLPSSLLLVRTTDVTTKICPIGSLQQGKPMAEHWLKLFRLFEKSAQP